MYLKKFEKKIIYPVLPILLLLFFNLGCDNKEVLKDLKKISEHEGAIFDTILTLGGMKDENSIFKTRGGNTIKVEMMSYDSEDVNNNDMNGNESAERHKTKKCDSDEFAGTDRKNAKTSVVADKYQDFPNLDELINSLPADTKMENYHPKIKSCVKSKRVEEEQRNVKVEHAYICAIYREHDNDFHVILGSSTTSKGREYLTAEVSGLPAKGSDSYEILLHVRKDVVDFFGDLNCNKKYIFRDNPIEVEIKGSLFYDIDHRPGVVGAGKYRPKTSWEIHPVTGINFK